MTPDLDSVIAVLKRKNYILFQNPKGYDLNIVGIRTNDTTADTFNDWICVFYINYGQWNFFPFQVPQIRDYTTETILSV